MTRTIRFTLLEAKNPAIYAELESKIDGGMKAGDVILDMLQELHWRRTLSNSGQDNNLPRPIDPDNQDDFEAAINAMEDL